MAQLRQKWPPTVMVVGIAGVIGSLFALHFPARGPVAVEVPVGRREEQKPPQQESLARAAAEPFATARVVRSSANVLRTTLVARYGDNVIRGTRVHLRSYNGNLIGPTLRARPGDTLRIRLDNQLPQLADDPEHAMNVPHALNTTNLHTHGLHVSPEGSSDNVFLAVPPGQAQDYEIQIPRDHVAGTFWYHPHHHGSVALQTASGMAGALIIEGGLDEVEEIKQAEERIFVFQQIPFDDRGRVETLRTLYDGKPVQHWHESGRFTTINGVALPVIQMRPGEVQRWRFLHGGVHESLMLRLDGHPLHEIAVDGIPLGTIVRRDEVELQPGNRADVLVQASATPGVYLLRDGALAAERALHGQAEPERFLAKVIVAGPAKNMALPTSGQLGPYAPFKPITAEEVQGRRTALVFRPDEEHQPPRYFIDDRQFDPDAVPRRVLLGTAEEWTLSSTDGNHPFHIHVNPFEVIERDRQTGAIVSRVWRDTILVAKNRPVTIRTRYLDFPGKTVLHCHNLAHEDLGMMQNIAIVRTPAELTQRDDLPLPWRPRPWQLPDADGQWHRSSDFDGRPILLVFFQGAGCLHCVRQLKLLTDYIATEEAGDLRVKAVSPESRQAVARMRQWLGSEKMLLLADENATVFRQFHCQSAAGPCHGLFLLNAAGEVVWYRISAEAMTDLTPLRRAVENLAAK